MSRVDASTAALPVGQHARGAQHGPLRRDRTAANVRSQRDAPAADRRG